MKHYDFAQTFGKLYSQAVALYAKGQRGAETFYAPSDAAWLAGHGITSQYMYDYAEDELNAGEPGFATALAIEGIRRDYFLNAQQGRVSDVVLDPSYLPAKTDAVRGISWLPRLIPKTRAKLHGELPATLMYCCGGDRTFFKTHDIYPAEFLSVVWRHMDNDAAIVDWVVTRSASAGR